MLLLVVSSRLVAQNSKHILDFLCGLKVKCDKKRAVREAFVGRDELNSHGAVFDACKLKFRHENRDGLGITLEQQKEVCKRFAEELDDVISCILSRDITLYTDKRFPPIS